MTLLVWIAVALMVVGAAMLIAGIGAPGLWIAVIAVGIALVVIDRLAPAQNWVSRTRTFGDRREVRRDVPPAGSSRDLRDGIAKLRMRKRRSHW